MEIYIIIPGDLNLENMKDFLKRGNELEKLANLPSINGDLIKRKIRIYYNPIGTISYEVQDLREEKEIILETKYFSSEELQD